MIVSFTLFSMFVGLLLFCFVFFLSKWVVMQIEKAKSVTLFSLKVKVGGLPFGQFTFL